MPAIFAKIASLTLDNGAQYNNPNNWWEYLDGCEISIADDVNKLHPESQPSGRLIKAVKDSHKAMLAHRRKHQKVPHRRVLFRPTTPQHQACHQPGLECPDA